MYPMVISTIFHRLLKVPLHNPNGRQNSPALGLCKGTVKESMNLSTNKATPDTMEDTVKTAELD